MTSRSDLAVIILAAGEGTRMRSATHKVLHPIAGRPMLLHLLDTAAALGASRQVVVLGKGRDQVAQAIEGLDVQVAIQAEQKGTGHAVQQAGNALSGYSGPVLILYGDTPFVSRETLAIMLDRLLAGDAPGVVVLASRQTDPAAYGRVILGDGDRIAKMVEYKDASNEERAVDLCNSGMMAVRADDLFRWLEQVGNANVAGEYYLPDIVGIAAAEGRAAVAVEGDALETAGINSRSELAQVELQWQRRRRLLAMQEGATLIDPDSVWFAFDTQVGRDVLIEPNVVFGPGVEVADGAMIRAFSHIEGATIGAGAEVGPFARLRTGSRLGEKSKVGNFVELKKTTLGAGAKANHLSYVGDSDIGEKANIGAGTITCNYDGFGKHRTIVGAGAFIGSNSALVAPVVIGDGAIVGAGSVITRDVEADSLALERSEQRGIAGWARRFREMKKRRSAE
ncbi:MAG: bifunctional UDP-N-acetylglucosamine diphosphorylase/glucosamine-1-phosphate N-acetyltransferase GlmU [Pseudomonadota bacterium]|nr:bifunctional UDP-N-acetylglucosamine diphosphorylase/glucosamine-1-phosphate N-acetyltransferase GlmU [Pseudomonadota bacterium]